MWTSRKRVWAICCITDTHNKPIPSSTPSFQWMFSPTPNTSVRFWHSRDKLQTVPVFRGFAGPCWWERHMQCVWRWRADGSQAVVRNRLRTQLTIQLWEPLLTIWWHLVELFVSTKLFNFIYACLRKKYVYVYSHNGIWICAMDKYLQARWKVIHQVYDSFTGWGMLDQSSWWDFLNRRTKVCWETVAIV